MKVEILQKPKDGLTYNCYISGGIVDCEDEIIKICSMLREVHENDHVNIFLNSDGGNLDSTLQMTSAMDDCKAKITCIIDGRICSAATLIFLSADDHVVSDISDMMIHTISSGVRGKAHEIVDYTMHLCEFRVKLLWDKWYADFLTEVEWEKIKIGQEKWLDAAEIRKRLKRVLKNK